MMRWYRSLIPGRMPLWLAAIVALLGASTLLLWIATTIGGGIVIPLQTGDTIRFEQVRQSAEATTAHFCTVTGLDADGNDVLLADFNLDDGRFGSDPPGGAVGIFDDPTDNCVFGPFAAPGEYLIYDSTDPDAHGVAKIIVVPRTYLLDQFVVEDGKFEMRMGARAYWGYEAEQRIPTIPGLIEIVMGPIKVGEAVVFDRCRQSASRSTKPHHITIDALGIDYDLSSGAVGVRFAPTDNCVFGPFAVPGEYLIYDSTDPDAHGVAKIIVVARTYVLDQVRVRDTVFELRMGDTTAWGYVAGQRVRTDDGATGTRTVDDITITLTLGESLVFANGLTGTAANTATHFITIDALGIDVEIAPGAQVSLGVNFTPTEVGTYRVYCSAHPDGHGGNVFIVVGLPK